MTKITITDPSEAAPDGDGTWTGYWSIDIEEYGHIGDPDEREQFSELVASMNVAPSALPDLNDPADAADFFEEVAEGIRALDEVAEAE